ncbi:MAG: tRNA (N6-threonylcarbamoyladenosine(37)-N6)-methyltransferase TrmO [Candidatus Bathyarchaeia archaeon]|jgi:tRNA-Thr(GGU) m(6)t(6)A37 methyltransferase TsaA
MTFEELCLVPVGFVKTSAVGKEVNDRNVVSQIVLDDQYLEAVDGVEEFSHLFVLFWFNQLSEQDPKPRKVHPCGRSDMPLVGVFATRAPIRPNPIGLTVVKLLKKQGTTLTVQGLDAFDGTPVLDIKPFDTADSLEDFKVADWWIKIKQEQTKNR